MKQDTTYTGTIRVAGCVLDVAATITYTTVTSHHGSDLIDEDIEIDECFLGSESVLELLVELGHLQDIVDAVKVEIDR